MRSRAAVWLAVRTGDFSWATVCTTPSPSSGEASPAIATQRDEPLAKRPSASRLNRFVPRWLSMISLSSGCIAGG